MSRDDNVRTARLLLELINKQAYDRLDEVYAYAWSTTTRHPSTAAVSTACCGISPT